MTLDLFCLQFVFIEQARMSRRSKSSRPICCWHRQTWWPPPSAPSAKASRARLLVFSVPLLVSCVTLLNPDRTGLAAVRTAVCCLRWCVGGCGAGLSGVELRCCMHVCEVAVVRGPPDSWLAWYLCLFFVSVN